jgi:hypothetical protein
MLMSTKTMQALTERKQQTKISNRKPAERIDGDRKTAAPSAVLRPVPVGR